MRILNFITYLVISIGIIQVIFFLDLNFSVYLYTSLSYLMIFKSIQFLQKTKFNFKYKNLVTIYLVIGVFAIIRGLFQVKDYWDWKNVLINTGPVMFLPILAFIGNSKVLTQNIFYYFIKYCLPFSILVFLLTRNNHSDGFSRFISPIYFIILMFPFIKSKWRLLIIIISLISFFSAIGSRSNTIRILFSFSLMSLYFIRTYIPPFFFSILTKLFFILPISLFVLSATGNFNVFKMDDYISGDYTVTETKENGEIVENNYKTDTRTPLYQEVISSGIKRDTWLYGESALGGYISKTFSELTLGSKGRQACEVGILNIFNQLGIIGVVSFSLIFFFSSFLAVTDSNNLFSKLLGLFIAFRWTYSWIEEFTNFDINYFFLWIMIGLCFSKSFRKMNDIEVSHWINGIFKRPNYLRKKYM